MKAAHKTLLIIIMVLAVSVSYSQAPQHRVLTIQHAFELAEQNSQQLKVAEKNTELARQKIEIAKLGQLPGISSSLNYGYLSGGGGGDGSLFSRPGRFLGAL